MTSDAKIGLLLGLVFIFVIAFVINGLPSLRPPLSKVDASTTIPPAENFSSSGVARGADAGVPSWTETLNPPRSSSNPAPAVVPEPQPIVQELPMIPPAQVSPPVASQEGVRSSFSLENLVNQLAPTVQREPVSTINVDTPRPTVEPSAATTRPAVAAIPAPQPAPIVQPRLAPETPTRVEPREAPRPAPVASTPPNIPGAKIYVVVEGDNLGTIAKKVYGLEEGNRMVNCDRIFQANLHIMPSRDSVVVGQKLIIPPLPKPTPTAAPAAVPAPKPNRPADVLPRELFERPRASSEPMTISEKVEALARRAPAAMPAPTPDARWYTVQEGDSLWKIASSQLGSGSRWDEIHKLNADILTREDSLKLGMKLRLPAK